MNIHVNFQIMVKRKRLHTINAAEWFLSCMDSHVNVQLALEIE